MHDFEIVYAVGPDGVLLVNPPAQFSVEQIAEDVFTAQCDDFYIDTHAESLDELKEVCEELVLDTHNYLTADRDTLAPCAQALKDSLQGRVVLVRFES